MTAAARSIPEERPGRLTPAALPAMRALRVAVAVLVPPIAQGVVVRRPRIVGVTGRLHADRRAVALLHRLRHRYRGAPLLLRLPRRRIVLLTDPVHVRRVLTASPDPYRLDSFEKHAALNQFEPRGVLISRGPVRARRRALNERALDTDRPIHRLADPITAVVAQEAGALLDRAEAGDGGLDWPTFNAGFTRLVRRIVLGDAAADDTRTTELLNRLRAAANWSLLRLPRTRPRDELAGRIAAYVERADPGCLASLLAREPPPGAAGAETAGAELDPAELDPAEVDPAEVDPAGQVPQWLFAFDAAGIATFRGLALLATHPSQAATALRELDDPQLGYLRACVLEAVRLWPTTLLILRDSARPTRWGDTVVPRGTAFAVPVTFLHRDPRLPYADRFAPDIWLDGTAQAGWSLVPFSGGPGACPGRNLVLLVTSTLLAALYRRHRFVLTSGPRLRPDRPLPHTIDHAAIRLSLHSA